MGKTCLICQSDNTCVIQVNYPGYILGSSFEIHKCLNCNSHFIIAEENTKELYDIIYSSKNTAGYDRYFRYAKQVKSLANPLKYLAYKESTYYPVYDFLKNKKDLKVLEIGCGYGYLSYSLMHRGFKVTGIDIAKEAIKFATENFGNFFYNIPVEEFSTRFNQKFDVIVSTEVIEHLQDPNSFLEKCYALLNENGKVILTTPDKDYSPVRSVWQSDLPPVHLTWIGKKGMQILAGRHNFKTSFTDFSSYYSSSENRLVKYIRSRKEKNSNSVLSPEGNSITFPWPLRERLLYYFFDKFSPVRFISNFIHNIFNGKEITMGVILGKNK
jgi:SAM-dependent methyltransferase